MTDESTPRHLRQLPAEPVETLRGKLDELRLSYTTRKEMLAFWETRTPHDLKRLVNALRHLDGRDDLAEDAGKLLPREKD